MVRLVFGLRRSRHGIPGRDLAGLVAKVGKDVTARRQNFDRRHEITPTGVIEHVIDGQMVETLYAHLQAGSMPLGSTDRSTGDHLHFEIRPNGSPVDSLVWLAARGL